jgi:hypothetical protein
VASKVAIHPALHRWPMETRDVDLSSGKRSAVLASSGRSLNGKSPVWVLFMYWSFVTMTLMLFLVGVMFVMGALMAKKWPSSICYEFVFGMGWWGGAYCCCLVN